MKLSPRQKELVKWIASYHGTPHPGLTDHQVKSNGYQPTANALVKRGILSLTDERTYNGTELYVLTIEGRQLYIRTVVQDEFSKDTAATRAAKRLLDNRFNFHEVMQACQADPSISEIHTNQTINAMSDVTLGVK